MDSVSGGWNDRDGSGKRSSSNGGFGAANTGGNSGSNRNTQSFLSINGVYGSGSGASGIWGSNYSESYGDGNYGKKSSGRMGGRY
ncbi:hypothetical protein LZ633_19910 [Enterobacter asburiae]|nr:hypothetical protein [Enterobacter asburiae]